MIKKFIRILKSGKTKIKPNIKKGIKHGLYGHVDNITSKGIYGWFINLDDFNDKNLIVYINGKEVGGVEHFFFRQDISEIIGKKLDAGFYIDWNELNIDRELFRDREWKIDIIHFNTGKKIVGKDKITEENIKVIKRNYLPRRSLITKFKIVEMKGFKIYIDKIITSKNFIKIIGCVFHKEKNIKNIWIELDNKRYYAKYGIERPDIFKYIKGPLKCGFVVELELNYLGEKDLYLVIDTEDNKTYKFLLGKMILINYESNWLNCKKLKDFEYILRKFKNPNKIITEKLPEPVDIIIPVFNGYEYLPKLFKALFENTNEPYRLIIIDDASTDYRVVEFLTRISEAKENVILIRNEKNLGFVRSVNRGFSLSQNHVAILNTDIELPPGWLYRLMKPIFEDKNIASTTPFTNSGTICSFPEFLKDNELPGNLNYKKIDEIFASLEINDCYIELPTGIGFCMGINKKALKDVGFFDEKHFEKGYGEENDWCMRARKKGYKNVLVPNLFVYHKHGGSFGTEEKLKLIKKNFEKLKKLHPEFLDLVQDFIDEDPHGMIRDVAFLISIGTNINTSLVIDHNLGGGANIYRNNLIKLKLIKKKAIVLYTEDYFSSYGTLKVLYQDIEKEFKVKDLKFLFSKFQEFKIEEIILNNLVSFKHPLKVLSFIKKLKEKKKARLIIPIHDYYMICPSYNLLNDKGSFCGIPKDINVCKNCLQNNPFAERVDRGITTWRSAWLNILNIADNIICFSNSSKKYIKKVYPQIPEKKFLVIPHKLDLNLRKVKVKPLKNTINVGVIGNINYPKGAKVISELADYIYKNNLPIKLFVIGKLNTAFIRDNIKDFIHIYGSYERGRLPDIIEDLNIHIILFPSIVPETFSYVVEESIAMDLPIVAFNIGAPAERLKAYNKAEIVYTFNIEDIIKTIKSLYRREYGIEVLEG